jgi:hypothetical protein
VNAAALFMDLMSCDTLDEVKAITFRKILGRPEVDTIDVSGLLTPSTRDALALPDGYVSLGGLAWALIQAGQVTA